MTEAQPASRPVSGKQIGSGVAWLMGFKMVDKGLGLVSTLFLARLLTPADFGLVAMAMAVVAFTQLMSAFGFESALIQRQNVDRDHFDTAWTFNVVFGVAIAVALVVLSVPMARFYEDDRLTAILIVLSVSALVGGFENIGVVAFRKELDFRREFHFLLAKRIVGFIVTIGLALTLRSYWALVCGTVVGRFVSVWISYRLHPYRPRLTFRASHDLMHFSKWIFLSSLIGFVSTRSTDFVLGRTVGAHGLGLYSISFEIATMPSTEMIAPLNRAVYPVYARLAPEPAQLRERFLSVFGIICLLGFPVCAGLFAVADSAVRVVLGDQWLETIAMIRIFAMCGLIGALQSNMYLVIVAMGRPRANTVMAGCLTALSVPVLVWSSLHYGVVGAGYARLAEALAEIVGVLWIFHANVGIAMRPLWRVVWRPATSALLMTVVLLWIEWMYPVETTGVSDILYLLACIATGAVLYLGFMWVLWRSSGSPPGGEALAARMATKYLNVLMRRPVAGSEP